MSGLQFAFLVGACLLVLIVWAALEPVGEPRQFQSIAVPPDYEAAR